jgi:50S ribosomal protein L16 3-hydroxylase
MPSSALAGFAPCNPASPFGALSLDAFFEQYWQKKPLLVKGAFPGFDGLVDAPTLFKLACNPDVESRWVAQAPAGWILEHAPQSAKRLALDAPYPWTVLVQGLNLWHPVAQAFLAQFRFIPQARLDDLMVSYATEGGGVGPHFDDYDVFLIQGTGRRRWQISEQADRRLVEGAPLKILADFVPEQEWVVEPGDLLYLPPHWAHNGVALDTGCTTYSVGFRAPRAQELGEAFLMFMQDRLSLSGLYADPDLRPCRESGRIDDAMVDRIATLLSGIRWGREEMALFAGTYLSEPKPHLFFSPQARPLSLTRFSDRVKEDGFELDPRTLLLFNDTHFFMNGECMEVPEGIAPFVQTLANERALLPATLHEAGKAGFEKPLFQWLYEGYCDGFGHLPKSRKGLKTGG